MDNKLKEEFAAIKQDPALFAEKILKCPLLPWQKVVAREFIKSGNDYVAIRSSIGTGKSFLCAVLSHWALFTHNDIIVQLVGPSFQQVQNGIFKELKRIYSEAPEKYQQLFTITSSRMTRKDSENSFAFIQTAPRNREESLQGVHAQRVYSVIDESSGVTDAVYEAIRNAMSTSNSKLLCVSNPRHLNGWFYKIFNGPEGRIFKKYKISAADSPMVSKEYIDSITKTFGKDHAEYKIKILGEFAELDSESLAIVPDIINAAFDRGEDKNVENTDNLDSWWAVDVAGAGADRTILVARTNKAILSMEEIKIIDQMEISGHIVDKYQKTSVKPLLIYVDSIGIGEGVSSRLKEVFSEKGYGAEKIVAVKASHKPSDNLKYLNLKAECTSRMINYFHGDMREDNEIVVNGDAKLKELLREELFMLKQDLSSSGKILYKPRKDDYRRELGRSPDVLDALSLTFSGKVYSNEKKWQKIDYSVLDKRMRI